MNRALFGVLLSASTLYGAEEEFLGWSMATAKRIALSNRVTGQVGKSMDLRVTSTDRSINFKLRATWLTPPAIQALARIEQISKALTAPETRTLVSSALATGPIVIQVEIDPREGSGIIPGDWVGLLGPRAAQGGSPRVVRGTSSPKLSAFPGLSPIPPRDYAYEIFWLVFPTTGEDGAPLFSAQDTEAELAVRIQGKVGKVRWPIPAHLLAPPSNN